MKNYTNLTALLCLAITIVSCGKTPTESLDHYATELVKLHQSELQSHSTAIQMQVSPLSYLTDFSTNNQAILTSDMSASDQSDYKKISAITEQWQKMYCTKALQSLMQENGIEIASARLIDALGKARSTAMCIAPHVKNTPPLSDATTPRTAQFSLSQICKAGLSLVYGRDTNIMSAKMNGDQVQVQYTRPTDGKAMSYRCKLDQALILTWDDSIAGARWYGSEPGDSKLEYRITGEQLVVRDMIKGVVSNEKTYSPADISGKD